MTGHTSSVYTTGFDPETADVCHVLLEAVSTCAGTPARSLPILQKTVDPDALEAFIEPGTAENTRGERVFEFRYAGYEVTIHSKGQLTLSTLDS